jgi:hypothetical protein
VAPVLRRLVGTTVTNTNVTILVGKAMTTAQQVQIRAQHGAYTCGAMLNRRDVLRGGRPWLLATARARVEEHRARLRAARRKRPGLR